METFILDVALAIWITVGLGAVICMGVWLGERL